MKTGGPGALRRLVRLVRIELGEAFGSETLGHAAAAETKLRRWADVLAAEELAVDPPAPSPPGRVGLAWLLGREDLPFDEPPAPLPRSGPGILASEDLPFQAPAVPPATGGFLRRLLAPEPLPLDPGREGRA